MELLFRGTGNLGAARAVRAYLEAIRGLDGSFRHGGNNVFEYEAQPTIAEWHNGRERGYVISLVRDHRQLNIAFFQHRGSDSICAVEWDQSTLNPPTIDIAEFGDIYKSAGDVSFEVGPYAARGMAEWIYDRLERFWAMPSQHLEKTG